MRARFALHLVAFAALIGIGVWIAYRGLVAPGRYGLLNIDLQLAAMYWFALLVYGLIGLLLYYPLRWRSWRTLLIGHGFAAAVALASTATVIILGQRHAPASDSAPAVGAGNIAPAAGAQSAQPLPLLTPEELAESNQGQQSAEGGSASGRQ